jgi:hypothetical protein
MAYSAPGDQSSEGRSPGSQPRDIHNRNQNRNRESMAGGFGIPSPRNRGKRAAPNSLGIHSPEDRSKRGIPSSLIHIPAARSPDTRSQDIRKQDIRKLGSRCRNSHNSPVVEVCWRASALVDQRDCGFRGKSPTNPR